MSGLAMPTRSLSLSSSHRERQVPVRSALEMVVVTL